MADEVAAEVAAEVVIVGAGPAGCAAAISARRAGLGVMLVDKAKPGRDKTCGDGLTAMALRELDGLGVSLGELCEADGAGGLLASAAVPTAAVLRSPSGRETVLPLGEPGLAAVDLAVVVTRRELDAALLERARAEGAEVIAGVAVSEVRLPAARAGTSNAGGTSNAAAEAVELVLADGRKLRAQHLIAADGFYSSVRKSLEATAGAAQPTATPPDSAPTSPSPTTNPTTTNSPTTNPTTTNPTPPDSSARLGEWHAARQYLRLSGASAAQTIYVWFEPDLAPGYAWSFPLSNGLVNFGFCAQRTEPRPPATTRTAPTPTNTLNSALPTPPSPNHAAPNTNSTPTTLTPGRGSGQRMAQIWDGLLQRPHIAAALGEVEPLDRQRAWPIPARRVGASQLTIGPVLFCGDAAALADPLTGEGIGQALVSGRLAAEAIAAAITEAAAESGAGIAADPKAGPTAATAARTYERRVKAELAADNAMSRSLSRALSFPTIANLAIRAAGTSAWTRRNFARWLFEDYPRAIVFTPRRWFKR